MNYTIYDPASGQIINTISSADQDIIDINLQDKSFVEGIFDATHFYIKHNQPVEFPNKPTRDHMRYIWDWNQLTWIVDAEMTINHVRQQRNLLLADVDRVNPVWYASLTADQQQELITYRQALLAVPQQAGFPESVEWPAKPTWL